jgi:hypothetical protein
VLNRLTKRLSTSMVLVLIFVAQRTGSWGDHVADSIRWSGLPEALLRSSVNRVHCGFSAACVRPPED